ncbi:MAG: glycine C-acetyltransferase, partial [Pseudomonadota bacterium]
MSQRLQQHLRDAIEQLHDQGLYKHERVIRSSQSPNIEVDEGEVLNLCANNYLGLADSPALIGAAQSALDTWGFGMASVRFICGTQSPHKQLEASLSALLGTEDTILYSS